MARCAILEVLSSRELPGITNLALPPTAKQAVALLRVLRREPGLNHGQLAALVGASCEAVRRWPAGSRQPGRQHDGQFNWRPWCAAGRTA